MGSSAPPRRESLSSILGEVKKQSALDTLTAMGFPKARAEKALAATGNNGVNEASNWLLAHVNDLTLDSSEPREYIIYLYPTGDLEDELLRMNRESLNQSGWNSSHIYYPHITLCSFFRMADSKVGVLDKITSLITGIVREWPSLKYNIGLDLHTENNSFIGYFVTRDIHKLIEDMMHRVQREFLKYGVEMEPQKKQLHMTLAFQYNSSHQEKLMEMARNIKIPKDASWEIRIYSRLPVLRNSEVRHIMKSYQAIQGDELDLNMYDFVYMDPDEHKKSLDGWFKGTLYSKGVTGFFPGVFTQKTSQMDIWTLHRSIVLHPSALLSETNGVENIPNYLPVPNSDGAAAEAVPQDVYDNPDVVFHTADGYAVVKKQKAKKVSAPKDRKLFVVRHAQRCDFSFRSWFERSFDEKGNYKRFDLNCPPFLWPRSSFQNYSKDCPLTEIGRAQARITGEALRHVGETIDHVYSSCALRCVQTAQEIINGLGSDCLIRVEPALFEWCGWCQRNMPEFMTTQEFDEAGFRVDTSYNALMKSTSLNARESIDAYYMRSSKSTQHILTKHREEGGNILIVGHSGSIDACTRQLRGRPAYSTVEQLRDAVRGVPYCFLCCAKENVSTGRLTFCDPPIPILTHGMNKEYDWRSIAL